MGGGLSMGTEPPQERTTPEAAANPGLTERGGVHARRSGVIKWKGKPRHKRALSGPNHAPRSQNVKRMLSERETVVEAADCCPCVEKLRTVSPSTNVLVSEPVRCS
jgi:hypothetical protein